MAEVTIEQGTLRGSIGTDIRGDNFYKFQGIPYARPPIGEFRFKAPVPPEKWSGVYDATKEGDICCARDPLKNQQIFGTENCLFINVFTKRLPDGQTGQLRPVLVWIHGGGFFFWHGNEELYGPDFLMTEDVVVVTMNYRLGLLGFLSLEDPSLDVPGNAGLKDQVMALKWVHKNIAKFGGDPNNVTIFGESAGGTSVHLHVLSPMSKGLFHKAIAQSGTALLASLRGSSGIQKIAPVMNLSGADEKTVYGELMKKSPEELIDIQDKLFDLSFNDDRPFAVVVEKNSQEPFLPDEPVDIILSGNFNQVPLMVGYTSAEGMLFDLFKSKHYENLPNFEILVPRFFGYKNGSPEIKLAAEKIKKFYFGNGEPSDNISNKYDVLSDCHFIYAIYETISTHRRSSKSPIYLYRMSIETELNFFKKILKIETPGASHCDDLGYLFKNFATPEIKPGSVEDIAMTRFVKLWTNFAKFANPTPEKNDKLLKAVWKQVSGPNFDFLDIGRDLVPSSTPPETERVNFWKQLFAESPAGRKNK